MSFDSVKNRMWKEMTVIDKEQKGEEKSQFVCWTNEKEKILSFHFEEGYKMNVFESRTEYRQFIILFVASGYKVQ